MTDCATPCEGLVETASSGELTHLTRPKRVQCAGAIADRQYSYTSRLRVQEKYAAYTSLAVSKWSGACRNEREVIGQNRLGPASTSA